MASNALSARRQPLRRPKVCKSAPNPGRCHPPPPPPVVDIECSALPSYQEAELDEGAGVDLHCWNKSLPIGDLVSVDLTIDKGEFNSETQPFNNTDGTAKIENPEEGLYTWSVLYTFSDSSTCASNGTLWTPPTP